MRKILFGTFVFAVCSCAFAGTNTTWRCTWDAWTYKDGMAGTNTARTASMYLVRSNDVATMTAFVSGLSDGSIALRNIASNGSCLDSRSANRMMAAEKNVDIGNTNLAYAVAVVLDKWSVPGKTFYLVSKPEYAFVGGAGGPGGLVVKGFVYSSASFESVPWKEVTDSAATVVSVAAGE